VTIPIAHTYIVEQGMSDPHPLTPQHITIPLQYFPKERHKILSTLNRALEWSNQRPGEKAFKDLWKWYELSRKTLSTAWHHVPPDTWKLLWKVFSRDLIENSHQMAHIKKLGMDMNAAGVQLESSQKLLHIEAQFVEGDHKDAIRQWESARTAFTFDPSTAREYWTLGVRMLANDNQPERAQDAIDTLINGLDGESDPRVLVSIIRSWLASSDGAAVQRAWALYVRLKYLLGPKIEMGDYDAIIGNFFEAKQADLALAVFRDMMITGEPSAYHQDSISIYKRTLKVVGDLRSFNLHPAETSWTSSKAFTCLPRKHQNKYFFGSWIKKLIGDGEVDAAAQVVELMSRRGIIPDSKYMNGIIGAWLRSGNSKNHQKAEELAWKMIDARLEFVKSRDEFCLKSPVRAIGSTEKPDCIRLMNPRISTLATIETFCILINYYLRRRRGDRVQDICLAIKAAKIRPNTSFLNDLLSIGTIQHRTQWVWNAYVQLVQREGVSPDQETFAILWQIMREHVNPKLKKFVEYPSPRELFAEMAKWPPSIKRGVVSREVYEMIIECFLVADDQIGTTVALRSMQHLFDIYPTMETSRNIILQLAVSGTRYTPKPLPRQMDRGRDTQSRAAKLTDTLRSLTKKRTEILRKKGVEFESMDDTTKLEELVLLLCDLLRFAAKSSIVHPNTQQYREGLAKEDSSTQQLTESAAYEMGVLEYLPLFSLGLDDRHR
jgi:pentatricopeptide repeat protein